MGVKKIKLVDAAELKELTLFNISGVTYFGKINVEDKIKVSKAIIASSSDFNTIVKEWLKAKNLDQLHSPEFGGPVQYSIEHLSMAHLQKIDLLVMKLNEKLSYLLVNEVNNVISDL